VWWFILMMMVAVLLIALQIIIGHQLGLWTWTFAAARASDASAPSDS
jgi:hypothetical protein